VSQFAVHQMSECNGCGVLRQTDRQTDRQTLSAVMVGLGAFAKLRNATIGFVVSVRLSVRMEQVGPHRTAIHDISYLSIFRKSVAKIQVSLKSDTNKWHFTRRPVYIYDIVSRRILLRMKNVSYKTCRENRNTHFMFSHFFRKSCCL
jgi:hypothetical protein